MESRGRLRNYEKAYIIELYVSGLTMRQVSKIAGVSIQTVSKTVYLYTKKPTKNLTLKSRV